MRKKKKFPIIRITLLLAIILVGVYSVKTNVNNKKTMQEIFEKVENTEASLTEYIVYGTHLNIKGECVVAQENVSSVSLILASYETEEKINLDYEQNGNKIVFSTGNLIN